MQAVLWSFCFVPALAGDTELCHGHGFGVSGLCGRTTDPLAFAAEPGRSV